MADRYGQAETSEWDDEAVVQYIPRDGKNDGQRMAGLYRAAVEAWKVLKMMCSQKGTQTCWKVIGPLVIGGDAGCLFLDFKHRRLQVETCSYLGGRDLRLL